MPRSCFVSYAGLCLALAGALGTAFADEDSGSKGNNSCAGLPSYTDLKSALAQAVSTETSGLNLQMWGRKLESM